MVKYSIVSCNGSGSYAKAVAGEVSRHLSWSHNLPKPVRQNIMLGEAVHFETKTGDLDHHPWVQDKNNCTGWMPFDANVNETALPKWISPRTLDRDAHSRWTWGRGHPNILDTQMKSGHEARQIKYGELWSMQKAKISYNEGNKLPGTCNDPEGEDPKNANWPASNHW